MKTMAQCKKVSLKFLYGNYNFLFLSVDFGEKCDPETDMFHEIHPAKCRNEVLDCSSNCMLNMPQNIITSLSNGV